MSNELSGRVYRTYDIATESDFINMKVSKVAPSLKPAVEAIVAKLYFDPNFKRHMMSNTNDDSPEGSTFWDDKVCVTMIRDFASEHGIEAVAVATLPKISTAYKDVLKDRRMLRKHRVVDSTQSAE